MLPAKQSPIEHTEPEEQQQQKVTSAPHVTADLIAKVEPESSVEMPSFQFQNHAISSSSFGNHLSSTDESKNLLKPINLQPQHDIDDLQLDVKNINLNSTYNDNFTINSQYNAQQSMPFNPLSAEELSPDQHESAKRIDSRRHAVDENNYQSMPPQNTEENLHGNIHILI